MQDNPRARRALPRWVTWLITLAVIGGAGTLIFTQLPRGAFSTDLSLVGQGKPAVVVSRDISYVAGAEVMDLLNGIRPDYADRVEFLVAHLGRPEGQAFARRYDAADGTVVVFNSDGSPVSTLRAPRSAVEVRRVLDTAR